MSKFNLAKRFINHQVIFKTIFMLLILGVYLTACQNTKENDATAAPKVATTPAPAFTVTTVDGRQLNLTDLKGKVVLLNFWASWCPPCLQELPHLESLYEKYHDQGLVIVGMNVESDRAPEEIRQFAVKMELKYPVAIASGKILADYRISPIPHSYFINREGMISDQIKGFGPGAEQVIEDKIKTLLKS